MNLEEQLSEAVHKAYCQYCFDVKGEEYWTKGDYSLLDDDAKEADRYTVRAVLKELEIDVERVESIIGDKLNKTDDFFNKELAQEIAKEFPVRVKGGSDET